MRTTRLSGKILVSITTGILLLGILSLSLLFSFSRPTQAVVASSTTLTPFTITSPNFHDGGPLSVKNEFNNGRCLGIGLNTAPALHWKNAPVGTQSFVLIVSDFDATTRITGFHHWIVYNIPADAHQLKGNNPFTGGTNDFGLIGYDGPCPLPTGQIHHYHFTLYAINLPSVGAQGLTYTQVIGVIQNAVVSSTSIIATFHLPM
jgi:Raf kinase inhibitor-like YbhB/YbcL family protein